MRWVMLLAYPGAPVYHSTMPGVLHPRTGGYLCSSSLVYEAGVELAHMWGVPALAGAFGAWGTAAIETWDAGGGAGGMMCVLCGAETGSGMGPRKGSAVHYPEAAEPRGRYLKLRHTRQNVRKIGYPELTAQPTRYGGFRDPIEMAREKTDWILENHHPEPLDEAQQEEFKPILQAAERELG